jgi:hypothetical protein
MKKFGFQPRSRTVLKSAAPAIDDTQRPFFFGLCVIWQRMFVIANSHS